MALSDCRNVVDMNNEWESRQRIEVERLNTEMKAIVDEKDKK